MRQIRPQLSSLPTGDSSPAHLRAIAEVAIQNNAESVLRGDIIKAWQGWYDSNKEAIDKAIKTVTGSAVENDLGR